MSNDEQSKNVTTNTGFMKTGNPSKEHEYTSLSSLCSHCELDQEAFALAVKAAIETYLSVTKRK